MPSPIVVEGLPQAAEGTQSYGGRFFFMNVLATPSAVVTGTPSAEQSVTVTGLASTDMVVGINKPTVQATLAFYTGRVSAANTLKLTYGTGTVSAIPTASENYLLLIFRPSL